jgi:hypothetical protein
VAYLVLSHRRPDRVEALAARILELSPSGQVVVHHDAHGEGIPWAGSPPPRAHLLRRTPVAWGDWSLVDVSLQLVRYARDSLDADWFVLLSGDDRPVVDLASWEEDIRRSGIDGVVANRPITRRPRWFRRPTADDINYVRYMYRWQELPRARHRWARLALETLRRAGRFLQPLFKIEYSDRRQAWYLGLPRRSRSLPNQWRLYVGPQWVAFGARAAAVLFDADPPVLEWFRDTWIPDQAFVQTVLANHPDLVLCNQRLTYLPRQKRPVGPGSWMVVRTTDLDDVWTSGCAFARKIDPEVDDVVSARIDARIDRGRAVVEAGPDAGDRHRP